MKIELMNKEDFEDILIKLKEEINPEQYICPVEEVSPNRFLPDDHPPGRRFVSWKNPNTEEEKKIEYITEEEYQYALKEMSIETGKPIKREVAIRGFFTKEYDSSYDFKKMGPTIEDGKTLVPELVIIDNKFLYNISLNENETPVDWFTDRNIDPEDVNYASKTLAKRYNKALLNWLKDKIEIEKKSGIHRNQGKWQKLRDKVVDWFTGRNIDPDKIDSLVKDEVKPKDISKNVKSLSNDTKQSQKLKQKRGEKYGHLYYDWHNFKKQNQVEIMANLARTDMENSNHIWQSRFKAEFPDGYSVQLGRYRDKFTKHRPGKKFSINGLSFYKG